ncbi:SOS-induced cell division inhibitor SulA [Pseudomonas sp. DTU_2021_1001937_2_SI_NGA_ILE_001]|uniref:SOS-induced cell division inhibitor SulA n=1 Tax=Pseudomonas sp. DTU_2021_1001937_2_SI_NGA_ILE_001 TaxID=3077589 RepID=UPI0028FC1C92|nr:SOS-induced cell division inhibitor SulA [Pseudomonas sp. DTU_2021_1001937_2_SI_NGA_ILE_001]WNW09630.1 SOS-induced cell division inhibitor SulA [Pseudomonas sp. DTU_2021_1001937_2_SI_NGA_ILE_001]
MQFHPAPNTQLPLFEAFLAQPMITPLQELPPAMREPLPEVFSELSLRGAAGNCLGLLAPILRELSQEQDARWLTLIAPPANVTQTWLRDAGLNRERILILRPRSNQTALDLTREALRLGRSHTVVSWLSPLSASARQQLTAAARDGEAQSLNVRLG